MPALTGVVDHTLWGEPSRALNFLRELGRAFGQGQIIGVEIHPEGPVRVTVEYPSMGAYLSAMVQRRALTEALAEDLRGRGDGG